MARREPVLPFKKNTFKLPKPFGIMCYGLICHNTTRYVWYKNITTEWIRQNKIKVLEWLSLSPDLNLKLQGRMTECRAVADWLTLTKQTECYDQT